MTAEKIMALLPSEPVQPADVNDTIPCYKGGHKCNWPACPSDCDGRPGLPVRPEAPAGVREAVIEECAKVAEGTAPISSGNFFAARRDQCAKIAAKIRNLATLPSDPVRRTTQGK